MDGKRGQGDEDGAAGLGWLSRMITVLEGQAESALTTMVADVLSRGDTVGADRKARAVTNVAKAGRAIEILRPRPDREPPLRRMDAATAEDSMNEDDDDSVDPASSHGSGRTGTPSRWLAAGGRNEAPGWMAYRIVRSARRR